MSPPERPPSLAGPFLPLSACLDRETGYVGRKAAVLAWAEAHDIPTPGGLVLPASRFWSALEACGAGEQARYLAAQALRLDPRHTQDLAATIHQALAVPAVADLARADAGAAFARLDAPIVVCRSSSALEDGRAAAFPGVFVSKLGLRSPDALAEAIVACWRSAFSRTAFQYLLRLGAEPIDLSLAVLIQPQVEARWYGLYVSRDPVTGASGPRADLTTAGPEALVDGAPAGLTARRSAGGWESDADIRMLTPALDRMYSAAQALAAWLDAEVDIEFAIPDAAADPVLLQCRPLTGAASTPQPPPAPEPGPSRRLRGRPCAPGQAMGRVSTPSGTPTPHTEPRIAHVETLTTADYDVVFAHAGVVMRRDASPLSHVAILCRELGVPMVCGVEDPQGWLGDGWVWIDGAAGTISIMDAAPSAKASSRPDLRTLYFTDVEEQLEQRVTASRDAGAYDAASLTGRRARSLGADRVVRLAVRLGAAETADLAALRRRT